MNRGVMGVAGWRQCRVAASLLCAFGVCLTARRGHAEAPRAPRSELILDGSAGVFPYLGVTPALTYRYGRFATTAAASFGVTLAAGTAQEVSLGVGLAPIVSPRVRGLLFATVGVLFAQNVAVQYECGGFLAFEPCNSRLDTTVPFVGVRLKVLGSAARDRPFAGATFGLDYTLFDSSRVYEDCYTESGWLFGNGPQEVCSSGRASLTRFLITAQVSLGVSLL